MNKEVLLSTSLFFLLLFAATATAHFKLNLNIRIIHVEHLDGGLRVYMRLPMPYLVAHLVGPEKQDGSRDPAPFTYNQIVDGELLHYVDFSALQKDPLPLGELATAGHVFTQNGAVMSAQVEQVRIHRGLTQPPFSSLQEAKRSFATLPQMQQDQPVFVGDSVVDVQFLLSSGGLVTDYTIASTLEPGLSGQDDTANLVLDYYDQDVKVFRITGLLQQPITIERSVFAAVKTFVYQGIKHILSGTDHILFVLCLILGALSLGALAWRVTGFTLGHSVTLILGFFGLTPEAPWFIPLVETGIALSIIYVAVIALSARAHAGTVLMTTALGLLHGLGFAFVLHEILQVTAPNLWHSLIAFNIGVEIGQLAIVILIWPLLQWLRGSKPQYYTTLQWLIAVPCIAIAAVWTGQRATSIFAAL